MNALTTRREIFFIDARIEGYESILVGMGPAADTHILNQQTDGMSQILDALAQSDSRYDAVHLITHGSSAQIDLPGTLINADNLQQHKASLERIGGHLSADADFLVYGCNIGGDEAGRLFTQEFSKMLGVDVATSDDLTGAQPLGGDAVLEVRSGRIETPTIAKEIWNESAVLLVREKEPNYSVAKASGMGNLRAGGEVEGRGHVGGYITNDGPRYADIADYFKFTLSASASVEFDLSARDRDVAMRLWSSSSSSLSLLQADTRSDFSKELSKGTYYVRVGYDLSDWSNSLSDYQLTVTAPSAPSAPTPPRISSVSSPSAEEGNTLRFTVTLDRAPSETTTYYYATYRSTAQRNDYDGHLATPLVFRAGDRSETIRVQTREDTQDENDETFDFYITDSRSDHPSSGRPSNYLARATGTIRDDDDAPTPPRISSVSSPSAEEGETLRFTVTLDRAPSETTTYYYATYRSTAQRNDYDGHLATPLVFRAGDRSQTIRVQTREDTQDENDETFEFYITDSRSDHPSSGRPSNYLARATGTIRDDDDAPTPPRISSVSSPSAEEGETLRFTVTLDRAPSETTTYYYATYRSTAQRNDYDGHLATPLVFRAGDRSQTIRVQTREDTQDENDETFEFYITDSRSDHPSSGRPSNYLARATGTIRDDDDAPTPPRISSVSSPSAEEGETLRFTVTLDRAPSETTTYYYATYRSTAQRNDYDGHLATPLVFRAGDRSKTIDVQTREDTQDENDETFDFYITDSRSDHPSSGLPSNFLARATGTIRDDNDAPTPPPSPDISVSVSDESAMEGEALRFTVTLDRAPSETTTYYYATYRSTAQRNDYDGHLATPLVFRAGDRSKTIDVQTREDTQDENDETFDFYITDSRSDHPSSGRPSNFLARATGTIRDDNDAPTPPPSPDISVSVSDESAMEGEALRFTVTLDRAPSETTTYYYATYRSTAQRNDYDGHLATPLVFRSGQTSKTIDVQTIADRLIDEDYEEQFYLYVTDAENKLPTRGTPEDSLGRGIGRIRDVDQDSIPPDNPSIIPPDNPDSIPPNIPSEPVSYRSSLEFALDDISLGPSFGLKLDDLYGEGDGSVNVPFLGAYDYAWEAGFLLELGGGVGSYDLRYDFDVLPEISGSETGIEFSTSDWEAADALDLSFDGLSLYAKTRLGFEFHITHGTEVYDWDYWTEIDLLSHNIAIGNFAGIDISAPDISGTLLQKRPQYRGGLPELIAGGSDDVFGLQVDVDHVAQQIAAAALGIPLSADLLEFELGPLAVTILDVAVRGEIDLVQEVRFSPEVRVDLYTPSGSLFQSKRLGDTFDLGSWGADDIKVEYTLGGDLTHRIGIQAEAKLLGEYLKAQGSFLGVNIDLGADNTFEKNIAESKVLWLYEPDPSAITIGSQSYTYQLPSASSTPNPSSNGPPQISLQHFTVTEGTASVGSVIASDPEDDAISYSLLSGGDRALFDITSEGVISFRVAPDYEAPRDSNSDNIYEVTVQVQDNARQFASAPVRVSVNNDASDDPQLAISIAIAVQEGEQVTLTRQMIDVQLTSQQTNNTAVFHVQEVKHGIFFLNGRFTTTFTQADIISRAVVFRHDGSEQAPTFKIAVSTLGRDPDSAAYQAAGITFTPINDAPRTEADYIQSAGGQVTIPVLENDIDPEGDSLEISRINGVSDGTATIGGDGRNIYYTPREGFVGNEEFTYEVRDDNEGISRGYVTVRVTGEPNTAPVAMDDSASTEVGRQVEILVLNNDADVNQDPLEITGVSEAAHGTVSIVNNAYLRYRPDADFTGTETLTYFISDSQGGGDTGRVSIQVNPVDEPPVNPPEPVSQNNAPVAIYDEFTIAEDIASVSLDVLENDYDVDDGDTLSLMGATANSGEVSVSANRILYTPLADYDGNVRITYQVSDGSSIAQGLALLRIRPVNDAPTLTGSSIREISALPGESLQLDSVAGWFRDVDADISTYRIHTGALPSGLSLNPSTGKWTGSISPHQQTTQYAFTVRATDSAGTYADQAVQISARDALLLYLSGSTGSDVMVVGGSLEVVANGGAGADHYVIPPGMFGNIRIIDQFGNNTLAFDQGVGIASVQQDFSILTVTLTGGNTIKISRPEGYTYVLGSEAGLSLNEFMSRGNNEGFFVTDQVTVPTTLESPADALQIYLNGNPNPDAFTLGFNQEARANGGAGADVYRISRFQKGNVEIIDVFGDNLINFESGVQITGTVLNSGTARLTLSTGAVVTVRDATTQKYQAGDGSVMDYEGFKVWVADTGSVPTPELLRGTEADDELDGGEQAEILSGYAGNDVLNGGGGSDVLNGGLDDDTLTGGSGSDSFVYGISYSGREWNGRDGEDTILDFSIADNDKLKLLDAQGIVSSIAHLEQGYDAGQYRAFVEDANLMLISFANTRQPENSATGSNRLKITLAENIDTSLYDANTGQFNNFDAFIDALGGDDSILFA